MKITGILAAGILAANITQAQETESITAETRNRKNEIGLFVNPFSGNATSGYDVPAGIQFKRQTTKHLGYRLSVAAGGYWSEQITAPELIKNDTSYYRSYSTNMSMVFVGAGLDIQQQLKGKCYIYAAVELRGGYGNGYTHYSTIKETAMITGDKRSYTYEQTAFMSQDASLFVLDSTPYVGAKFVFKRLVIGTELSALVSGAMVANQATLGNYNSFVFDMGQLQQRFYVNYRF
ncbi:MAG TPA: hypothetical protein VIN07_13750 [Flavipsychrobacter sp.]